ncbi:hypothetical protein JOQ06_008138 [Pogonophryne albipinna]|uniref:Laminin G domain-containing protein n=1 Tax=Pogonophryne albipinna TaxID=1090488 RepID=A0AAD6AIY8_9TELE|nr:hypothetical protein JOQ06_008138 [Pogonophryne albipinna]
MDTLPPRAHEHEHRLTGRCTGGVWRRVRLWDAADSLHTVGEVLGRTSAQELDVHCADVSAWTAWQPAFLPLIVAAGGRPDQEAVACDEVSILQELSPQVLNSSNTSMTVDDSRCPVLQVGQYSTLSVPLQDLLIDGFAEEFSLLVQLRSPQADERSVFTMLSPDSRVMLQLRISAYAIIFIGTQQRHYEFPVSGLSDGKWHHVALSVSAKRLALYVDCSLLESVDWVYRTMGISTEGLLMIGGIIEAFETPFEGHLRQLTFLMGDPDAAQRHCSHHPPRCGETSRKPPRSPRTNRLENILLSSNDLENLLGDPEDEPFLRFGTSSVCHSLALRCRDTLPGAPTTRPTSWFGMNGQLGQCPELSVL